MCVSNQQRGRITVDELPMEASGMLSVVFANGTRRHFGIDELIARISQAQFNKGGTTPPVTSSTTAVPTATSTTTTATPASSSSISTASSMAASIAASLSGNTFNPGSGSGSGSVAQLKREMSDLAALNIPVGTDKAVTIWNEQAQRLDRAKISRTFYEADGRKYRVQLSSSPAPKILTADQICKLVSKAAAVCLDMALAKKQVGGNVLKFAAQFDCRFALGFGGDWCEWCNHCLCTSTLSPLLPY